MMPPRLPSVVVTSAVTLLLALHWWLGVSALTGRGVTNDETAHLVSGYSYWRFNDYRLQPENGNLPQRWGALSLFLLQPPPRLDPAKESRQWHNSSVWRIGQLFFFGSGNDTDYMLFCARATMAFWSVAAGLLVFCWSRRLWGHAGGLCSLALYAVSPTTLAHGPLVTSDMCAAFWLLAAAGAWWRVSRELTWSNLLLSCTATGLAFVAKFSAGVLLPVFGLLILWTTFMPGPVLIAWGRSPAARRVVAAMAGKLGVLLALLVVHGIATWAIIWTFFGCRYSAFAPGLPPAWKFYVPWDVVMPPTGLWHALIASARTWHLLPEAYLQGFSYMLYAAAGRGSFLLGNYSITGWWWFFPYAWWAKSTLGELVAAAAILSVAIAYWWRLMWCRHQVPKKAGPDFARLVPLVVFAGVYGAVSITSHLNIGQRHILPVYLVLFVIAGALVRPAAGAPGRYLAALVLILSAIESWAIRPYYLTFYNIAAGGPTAGWRQLVDSSFDWGQGLPELAVWVRQHRRPGEPVYLSYFGTDDPFYEGIQGEELSPYYALGRPRRWFELKPGLYCISATMLQDVYSAVRGPWTMEREQAYVQLRRAMRTELAAGTRSPVFDDFGEGPSKPLWELDRLRFARLCTYLRVRRPDAVIGYNQFVYHLDTHEVHVAVDGSLQEMSVLMEWAMAQKDR